MGDSLAMMPWFPRDFIAATRAMRLAERGAYRDLLDYQWEMGKLPSDLDRLARLLGCTRQEFDDVWPAIADKFVRIGEHLINKRLEEHREKALQQRERKISGAKATNAKRGAQRHTRDTPSATDSATLSATLSGTPPSPSPSPTSESIHTPARASVVSVPRESATKVVELEGSGRFALTERQQHEAFARCKAAYPKRAGGEDWIAAENSFRQLLDEATPEELHAGVERYARHIRALGNEGTQYVHSVFKFFGHSARYWSQEWPIPVTPIATAQRSRAPLGEVALNWRDEAGG